MVGISVFVVEDARVDEDMAVAFLDARSVVEFAIVLCGMTAGGAQAACLFVCVSRPVEPSGGPL